MTDWKASVGEKGKAGEKGAEGLTVRIGEREEEEQEEKRDSRNGSIIRFGVVRPVEEHWSRRELSKIWRRFKDGTSQPAQHKFNFGPVDAARAR